MRVWHENNQETLKEAIESLLDDEKIECRITHCEFNTNNECKWSKKEQRLIFCEYGCNI